MDDQLKADLDKAFAAYRQTTDTAGGQATQRIHDAVALAFQRLLKSPTMQQPTKHDLGTPEGRAAQFLDWVRDTMPRTNVRLIQSSLKNSRYYEGEIDGDPGMPNKGNTWAAARAAHATATKPQTPAAPTATVSGQPIIALPKDDTASMIAFYGQPGEAGAANRTWANFPPSTRLYSRDGTPLKDYDDDGKGWGDLSGLHVKLKDRWDAAWAEIERSFSSEDLAKFGGNVTAGIYAYRPKKGGSSYSTHAWGAAADFNPDENRFRFNECTFPPLWFDIWERHGFLSGYRAWGHDAMHIQAAIPSISAGSYYSTHGLPAWIKQA